MAPGGVGIGGTSSPRSSGRSTSASDRRSARARRRPARGGGGAPLPGWQCADAGGGVARRARPAHRRAANLRPTPPLVTISASYGAGGSRIGPALAQRLGVDFLDRAIPTRVADRLAVPLDDALAHDEALGDAIGRLASSFALLPELAGAMAQAGILAGEDYRRETER